MNRYFFTRKYYRNSGDRRIKIAGNQRVGGNPGGRVLNLIFVMILTGKIIGLKVSRFAVPPFEKGGPGGIF